jgi:hypothetical protein
MFYMYLCIYNMYRQYIDIVLVNNIQHIFFSANNTIYCFAILQYIVILYGFFPTPGPTCCGRWQAITEGKLSK